MYLLDTGVVFELRKARAGQTDAGLAAWATGVARQHLFISALTLLELENGVARQGRSDKGGGATLREWIDGQLIPAFEGRILAIDTAVVKRRAQIALPETRDALLAATAAEYGLTLVTRNIAAFKAGKIKLFNPWGYTPDAGEDEDWGQAGKTGPLWLKNLFVRT